VEITQKLAILADAAKYDASCASSGSSRRDSVGGKGIGSTEGAGICHSYAPDGRCISLLKILLTNFCTYDCLYCVNRVSSNVPRARFSVDEVVQLTLSFYRRNCIEGLFLSSGIIQSPDYTMERVVEVARVLREEHDFRGYIHLKTIPDASPELLARAGRYADRLSINIELPTVQGLEALAPEKDSAAIKRSMARLRLHIDNAGGEARDAAKVAPCPCRARPATRRAPAPRFAPAGQSTQMIVGADGSNDRTILQASTLLYSTYRMRRVYYSAFSPIPDASSSLPLLQPPLMREHRLYQADWLIRFYGFAHDEIVAPHRIRSRCRQRQQRHARARRRPQARLGAGASRPVSGRHEPRPARDAAARAGAGRQSRRRASWPPAACGKCAPTTCYACTCR
jgi:putative DNA modification/repair radical SAM protein